MKNKKVNLFKSKFISLFLVSLAGWIIYMFNSLIDTSFAGQFLNENALAAVGIVLPFYTFIYFISCLFSHGCAVKYSTFLGQGKIDESRKAFFTGFIAAIFISVFLTSTMYFLKDQLLGIFNIDEEVYEYSSNYYNWYIAVGAVYPFYAILSAMSDYDGETTWSIVSSIGSVVSNAVISYILINTKLGINGLGIGTFFSILIGLALIIPHYFRKTNSIKFKPGFKFSYLKDMFILGLGVSLSNLSVAVVDFVMNYFIGVKFGTSFIAAYTIVNLVLGLTTAFTSTGSCALAFIGIAKGSKNKDDLNCIMKISVKTSILFGAISSIIICSLCTALPRLYGITPDSHLFRWSWFTILFLGATYTIYSFVYTLESFYTSLGAPYVELLGELLINLIFPIVLPIALSFAFDSYFGLLLGFFLTPIFSIAVLLIFLIIKNPNRKIYPTIDITNEIQFTYDFMLSEDEIMRVRNEITDKLNELKVENSTVIKTKAVVEDLLFIILYKNEGNKVIDRITISLEKDCIRIINRSNGKVFNTVENQKEEAKANNYLILGAASSKGSFNSSLALSFNSSTLKINRKK